MKESRYRLVVLAALCQCLWSSSTMAQEIWQTDAGRACIERWISDTTTRLNRFVGDADFNANKPWSMNQYGHFMARNLRQNYEPDVWWSVFRGDKYHYMWGAVYTTEQASPDWGNPNFNNAGVRGLRAFVRECYGGVVPPPLPPPVGPTVFGGSWTCPGRGTLTLWQDGARVTGEFSWNGGGRVSGTIQGNTMVLDARENGGRASTWTMNLSSDGSSTNGTWRFPDGAGGDWGCSRSGVAPPPPLPVTVGFLGMWTCPGRGTLTLWQDGARVTGEFSWNGGGRVSGTIQGNTMVLDARENSGRASTWTMNLLSDGSSMNGTWRSPDGAGGDWGCRR